MKTSQRSKGEALAEIYIADTLGELGLFFRLCKTTVMGGTFADIGGHNPIEPGQLGSAVYLGPVMYNFITIAEDFLTAGAAVQVKDAAELREKLRAALANPDSLAPLAAAARNMTLQKSHIVDELAALLRPFADALVRTKVAS